MIKESLMKKREEAIKELVNKAREKLKDSFESVMLYVTGLFYSGTVEINIIITEGEKLCTIEAEDACCSKYDLFSGSKKEYEMFWKEFKKMVAEEELELCPSETKNTEGKNTYKYCLKLEI